MNSQKEERDIVLPDLSYKIMGAIFSVGNSLPWGLPEKDFQKAVAATFSERGIPFKREVYIPVRTAESLIGKYFADFTVDDRIVLELKVIAKMGYAQARQLLTYLRAGGYKLGILIYFTKDGVKYRRVLNPDIP